MPSTGFRLICAFLVSVLALVPHIHASITLDVNDEQSLKEAAKEATYGMMLWYHGNETGQIPGSFPEKWWEGGALFYALVNYWHFTGDDTYNEVLRQGLEFQSGDDGDYMPSNYSSYLGNDDQGFWGLAAMHAAEMKLPDTGKFSWTSLAQGVFNTQKDRWDTTKCGGGLRWQLQPYQGGYTMKNSVSNGVFFQIAARLYRYTGEELYKTWAEKVWDWTASSPLMNNKTWHVADSTEMSNNCATSGDEQWTYTYGAYMMGAAYMYNYTKDDKWLPRTKGLLNTMIKTFFLKENDFVMEETTCEIQQVCDNNNILFKGLTANWFAFTGLLVPETYDLVLPKLQSSARGAAKTCDGHGNNSCGVRWWGNKWDGWSGMEEQISVSQLFSANLVKFVDKGKAGPVTHDTGGNSTSNMDAGKSSNKDSNPTSSPITSGDKAGAGVLTAVFVAGWAGMLAFVLVGG
ncbi:hypothetical protein N7492_005208 [Penicillium capsulatum]|uniref:Mannan endo-1,6-alpha-mannosidase n=1 Tax=Penicillium capsulatum TaxID=69766 RepID=A0A9W9LRP3_9EURO|nr:hypothetical protein N7492_005208 [Penicillium capsulatum]KAJ6135687.1 hypothetical protein N7512_000847 [Penicillium capsulatum]